MLVAFNIEQGCYKKCLNGIGKKRKKVLKYLRFGGKLEKKTFKKPLFDSGETKNSQIMVNWNWKMNYPENSLLCRQKRIFQIFPKKEMTNVSVCEKILFPV